MACNLQRFVQLPIPGDMKEQLVTFLQKHPQECELVSQASDEEVMSLIQDMMQNTQRQGGPQPQPGQQAPQQPPQARANSNYVTPSGVPQANDPTLRSPMQMVQSGATAPRGYMRGGIANLTPVQRYGFGGFVKRLGKKLKGAVGGNSGLLGGIIGAALAPYTAGLSLPWGASLGAGAATYLKTGDFKQALGAGISAYGIGAGVQSLLPKAASASTTFGVAGTSPGAGIPPPVATNNVLPSYNTGPGGSFASGTAPAVSAAPAARLAAPVDNLSVNYSDFDSAANRGGVGYSANQPPPDPGFANKAIDFAKKYGPEISGALLLSGIGEDQNYQDVFSPGYADKDIVQQYYQDVRKYGIENVERPLSMTQTPNELIHRFGQRGPRPQSQVPRVRRAAHGGYMERENTDTDTIPAMLTPGEFVMTKRAVDNAGGSEAMYELMDRLENARA